MKDSHAAIWALIVVFGGISLINAITLLSEGSSPTIQLMPKQTIENHDLTLKFECTKNLNNETTCKGECYAGVEECLNGLAGLGKK